MANEWPRGEPQSSGVVYKVTTRVLQRATCKGCGDPINLLHTPASPFRNASTRWCHIRPYVDPYCTGACPDGGVPCVREAALIGADGVMVVAGEAAAAWARVRTVPVGGAA